jgi:RNA 3'-terminal phosphate cyclase (ATP)
MGIYAEFKILQAGYYPRGQGSIEVKTTPLMSKLRPITLLEQGEVSRIDGFALSSLLEERRVSDRMAEACQISLRAKGYNPEIRVISDTRQNPVFNKVSIQAGAALAIWAITENKCLLGSDMAGAPRRSAETIGKQVARNLIDDLETGATVDRFLADQLIPFCALADGTSEYLIPQVTQHIETRLWLVKEILGAKTQINGNRLIIRGIGFQR